MGAKNPPTPWGPVCESLVHLPPIIFRLRHSTDPGGDDDCDDDDGDDNDGDGDDGAKDFFEI